MPLARISLLALLAPFTFAFASAPVLAGCSEKRAGAARTNEPPAPGSAAAIAPTVSESATASAPPAPPPPPAKPELASKQFQSFIYEKPSFESLQLGYIRAGTKLVRAAEPLPPAPNVQPCGGQWYQVEPAGFVCAGRDGITLDVNDPIVTAAAKYPPKDQGLPYGYGMAHGSQSYARVPTLQDLKDVEGNVTEWRKLIADQRAKTPPDKLSPEIALPIEPLPSFLEGHAQAPVIVPWLTPNKTARGGWIMPSTRLAFVAAYEIEGRPYHLTSELLLVPADRVKVARPSDFHGVELAPAGAKGEHLPMVWVRFPQNKAPVFVYKLDGETATKTETLLPEKAHAEVALKEVQLKTGRFQELLAAPPGITPEAGARYAVRSGDVMRLDAQTATPPGVLADEVWVDVDIYRQMLVLYKGLTPTFATLITSGAGGKTHFTPLGHFRVYQKHMTTRMSAEQKPAEKEGEEGEHAYRFDDVPWVQYVYAGIALHAAFWHDRFGNAGSHGCINLSPADARYVFKRTLPELPSGWHSVNSARGGFPIGTLVVIHGG